MGGFIKGNTIELLNHDAIVIESMIGSGGTADTYKVLNVTKRTYQCAKHLYGGIYTTDSEKYYQKCRILAKYPSPHPAFVWFDNELAITDFYDDSKSFLYTMELLEGYENVISIIRNPEILKIKERIALCTVLAEAAKAAVKSGIIYGDWSANNVMWKKMDDDSISVRIIDCDPMSVPGFPLGMGGTGKYRSPEVMKGAQQSQQSDIFSLAVLVFRLFCGRHPLDGKRTRSVPETPKTMMKFYAEEPVFIFDVDNDSNRPSKNASMRFHALPRPLQLYFHFIFSNASLHGRESRRDYDDFLKILRIASEDNQMRR